MVTALTRRRFLSALGIGAASAAVPSALVELVEAEPVRRFWQVPAGAPVGGVTYSSATVRIDGREYQASIDASAGFAEVRNARGIAIGMTRPVTWEFSVSVPASSKLIALAR